MAFWSKNVILGFFGCGRHSFWGGLTARDKGDLGPLLSRSGMKRPVFLKVVFLHSFKVFFPKIISRSVGITACVPRREPQYSFHFLLISLNKITFLFLQSFAFIAHSNYYRTQLPVSFEDKGSLFVTKLSWALLVSSTQQFYLHSLA